MKPCIPKETAKKIRASLLRGDIKPDAISKMLPEKKEVLKSLLEDYIADKLNLNVSEGEVKIIQEKARAINEALKKVGDDLGTPAKEKETIAFFKAKREMDNFLLSKHPSPQLRLLTGSIGRGMMLFSAKFLVLNVGSNIEIGFAEALSRRIAEGKLRGANNKLAIDYVGMVNRVYQATGYDISRMTNIKDTGAMGERVLGYIVHSQGKGLVRGTGRIVEDIVFKQLAGAPDTAFASAHFADSINLTALKMAKGDKTKATEIMIDAMRIKPKTLEGEILRTQGIFDAQKATWTDTSWASRVSQGIRKILNDVSGDLRAGDFLLPFIKTPANVIATGIDYAGLGFFKGLFKIHNAFKTGNLKNPQYIREIAIDLTRAGLGLTGAIIIVNLLDSDDFVGAYDPSRAQIEQLRNSNYNAIRIKKLNKWISTDWLGPLCVPVTAMMYAKKYGKTGGEKTFQYTRGVFSSAFNIPGVADIYDFTKSYAFKKNQTLEEMTGATTDYITSQLYSRITPSFISDIAKSIDPNVRQGGEGIQGIIAKIPVLSKTLPVKRNIFGEEIKGEPFWSDILFGSRLKTDRENEIIAEINKISLDTGKGINFTNWDTSTSKMLAQFKEKRGKARYEEAKILYGRRLKERIIKEMNKSSYKRLSSDEKLKIINNLDTEVIKEIFRKYQFKYKKEEIKH